MRYDESNVKCLTWMKTTDDFTDKQWHNQINRIWMDMYRAKDSEKNLRKNLIKLCLHCHKRAAL